MGYIKQVILANSAGYPYAQVRIDGHCDIAGGQGVGKTTLMNAILFPLVVDDILIDITKGEKERFSEYYFKYSNSFIIYEVINNKDVPYCILVNRVGPALHFHFISAPFSDQWLFDEEGNLRRNWEAVRSQLEGINVETKITRDEFNRIFLGKGDSYREQYSIMKSQKGNDTIRPLLSSIFKNQPFTQETVKASLVESVKTSNQLDTEGIELGHYKKDLSEFKSKLSDIRLVTKVGKDGRTAINDVAENIFILKDKFETQLYELNCIPAKLAFSRGVAQKSLDRLACDLSEAQSQKDTLERSHNAETEAYAKEMDEISEALGEVKTKIGIVEEIEKKYADKEICDMEALVEWIQDKKHCQDEKAYLEKLMNTINEDASEINKMREAELQSNKVFYQNNEVKIKIIFNEADKALSLEKDKASGERDKDRSEIEKKYDGLIGKDWNNAQKQLIEGLLSATRKVEACETVEDARATLKGLENVQGEIGAALSSILSRRCGEGVTLTELKAAASEALKLLYGHLEDKVRLDKEKASEISAVERKYAEKKADIEKRQKALAISNQEKLSANISECKSKEAQINSDYDVKLASGSGGKQAEILELKERLKSAQFVLDAIENFQGCAIEDKTNWLDHKDEFLAKRKELNDRKVSVGEKKKAAEAAFKESVGEVDGKIQTMKQRKRDLEGELQAADKFIQQNERVKAVIDNCEPVETESSPKSVIDDYNAINNTINGIKDALPLAVQKLYEPGMLSRVDTFDIGIRENSRLSCFDDFMHVADRLEARLKGTDTGVSIDEYLRTNATLWLDCLKNVHSDLQPAEEMLLQIDKHCHEINRFMRDHNRSTCIDYVNFRIDEQSNVTDLVRLLREISKFYEENQNVLGYDNLFASEEEPANKKAMALLEKFSRELTTLDDPTIHLASMFDVKIDISEMGHEKKNLLGFNKPASEGTSILLKAMLNMTLLMIVMGKKQAPNTRLVCPIDEINKIEAVNLDRLTEFATAAGMYIIGSGQHHTQSALDYSYNVWNEREEGVDAKKYISMDARNGKKAYDTVQQ